MRVTKEDVSSVKTVLHIEIPQEDVGKEIDKAFADLKKNAKVKGFRPGKAPRSVLERLYKKDVHADVASKLIQDTFPKALQEVDLEVVGTPKIDPPELSPAAAYVYEATLELKPSLPEIEFKGIPLKKTRYAISDSEIDGQLKMLQKNLARLEPISEDRPAVEGDFVLITYEGFRDGAPFEETGRTENFTMKIGDGHIHEDFDKQMVGMKAGESKEIPLSFPEDYFNNKLAGQKISFQVNLGEIRKEILPDIDDELAKKLGKFQSLEEVKKAISDNLRQGYEKRVEQELNEQIFKDLLDKVTFEVPEVMIENELEGILDDAERSFSYHNKTLEELGLTRDGLAGKYRETAERQVRRHLILDKIIRQEKMELTDEELQEGFQGMADSVGQPVDQVKSYYQTNSDSLDFFKHTLLEKKAIKVIIDGGVIEEVEPAEPKETEEAAEAKE